MDKHDIAWIVAGLALLVVIINTIIVDTAVRKAVPPTWGTPAIECQFVDSVVECG